MKLSKFKLPPSIKFTKDVYNSVLEHSRTYKNIYIQYMTRDEGLEFVETISFFTQTNRNYCEEDSLKIPFKNNCTLHMSGDIVKLLQNDSKVMSRKYDEYPGRGCIIRDIREEEFVEVYE